MSVIDFSAFVDRLAHVSGEIILPFFRTSLGANDKSSGGAFDPVTEADRGAESAMRKLIREQFPAHGVIGEEFGSEQADAEFVWILDPIDGTKSFISGLPTWGTLIGLLHNQRPVFGMMAQPFTRERYSGDGRAASLRMPAAHWPDGGGPDWTTRTIRTRPCPDLSKATLMTTSPRLLATDAHREAYARVESQVRLVRFGGDCYCYCALAGGHVDLVIESGLKAYDIAPLIPIVEGAGGVITDWRGGDASKGGAIVAAGDARLHEAALTLLAGAAP